jgi:hypothetical protein
MGAALTTTERVGTTSRPGSGKRDGTVYVCRNQGSNPRTSRAGSNLVELGRAAAHARGLARTTPLPVHGAGQEAMGQACGVPVAKLPGKSWAPHPSRGQQ